MPKAAGKATKLNFLNYSPKTRISQKKKKKNAYA